MAETQNKINPLVAIAAVSVIIFSGVGVAVMTGVIPSSVSKTADTPAPVAEAPAPAPVEAPKSTSAAPKKRTQEPARVASAEPARVAQAPAPQICSNCGSVTSVNTIKQKGEGSGLGMVGGAVVGGVLGHQVGSGRGNTAATVIGAGAGAYAGNEVEKHVKSTQTYSVAVRMDDGSSRTFNYQNQPGFRAGDKVRVVEGKLVAD